VIDEAVEAACCQEPFCAACICNWLETRNHCPACEKEMKASELQQPHKVLCRIMGNWSIHCDFHKPALDGCPAVVPLRDLQEHTSTCPFNEKSTSQSIAIRTVRPQSTVEEVIAASPTKLRGDVAERLTAHVISSREEEGRFEVRMGTHGKSQMFERATVANVPSDLAKKTTLRRRSSDLTRHLELVSGGEAGARAQLVAGLQRLSVADQEQLLVDAGLKSQKPAAGTALAIKADLSLPWSQLRKLRQWLKAFGVEIESEQSVRSFIAKKLPSYTAKELPMTGKDGEVTMVAAVYFPNLVDILATYLDSLHEKGRLTWHAGAIPESEIWIKLGGDHGGGSFKLSFQVANTAHPNAVSNTIPVIIFNAKDTPANLETALGQYRSQLEEIQQSTWNGKSVRVFVFGDYEFQTVTYGLSGSSGLRPCLHCLCPKKAMALEHAERLPADHVPRTLETLADDHQRYTAAGSKLSKAKLFNNAIRPCILPVPVSNVIVPVLHLDLGIYPWLFQAFQGDLKDLDFDMGARCQASDADAEVFRKVCDLQGQLSAEEQLLQNATALINQTQQQLEFVALHLQQHGQQDALGVVADLQRVYASATGDRNRHNLQVTKLRDQIAAISRSKDFAGPCVASVEPVLQLHGIQRQVYHGGAFVGNHVKMALKPAVVTAITEAHLPIVQARCPELTPLANTISARYNALMSSYATCRSMFSHCQPVDEDELDKLQKEVTKFLQLCRKDVVARKLGFITPKLHLLEEHTVPMMRRLRVGLGLLGEQGAESLHSSLNSLESKFKNIPGELLRLKSVADQHLLTTTDEAQSLAPRPQSRKRKADHQGSADFHKQLNPFVRYVQDILFYSVVNAFFFLSHKFIF